MWLARIVFRPRRVENVLSFHARPRLFIACVVSVARSMGQEFEAWVSKHMFKRSISSLPFRSVVETSSSEFEDFAFRIQYGHNICGLNSYSSLWSVVFVWRLFEYFQRVLCLCHLFICFLEVRVRSPRKKRGKFGSCEDLEGSRRCNNASGRTADWVDWTTRNCTWHIRGRTRF